MKIIVLDAYTTNPGDLSWAFLSQFGAYTIYERTKQEDILPRCAGADILLTNKTPLDAATLAQLPTVRYIGLLSTGYNVVDTAFAKSRGITVTNIPAYASATVTQLTFALLLELCNHVGLHNTAVHAGEWTASEDFCFWKAPLSELSGGVFGILGFGKIGQSVARVAQAFGMQVCAVSDVPPPPEFLDSVLFCGVETLLQKADVISLHVPLTDDTAGMVDAAFLAKMKPSAFLINTARGPIIDEAALAAALNAGIIAGAGLDVLSSEPPAANNPLLSCKNCIITPHIAWATLQARQRLLAVCEENLRQFLAGNAINTVP